MTENGVAGGLLGASLSHGVVSIVLPSARGGKDEGHSLALWHDSLAEWSKALAPGGQKEHNCEFSPQRRLTPANAVLTPANAGCVALLTPGSNAV